MATGVNRGGVQPAELGQSFDFGQVLRIADALPMPIGLVDTGLTYRFVNRALADFFERPRSEILGRSVPELLGPKAYGERAPMFEAALRGERQWFAATFDHPARGILALQTEYLPQKDASGQVEGIVVLVQDVTEQRVAERALRESEARFRRIADSAPALIWVARLDGKFDFINQTYADFFGMDPNDAAQFDWDSMTHPDDLPMVRQKVSEGMRSDDSFSVTARFRRHDGEWRWLSAVSKPRRNADGQIIGYLGTSSDITVAKEAELELRRLVAERTAELSTSEGRFRAVFDTALEMIALMTPDGEYLEINRTASDQLGFTAAEVRGRKAWELPPVVGIPESEMKMRDLIARAAQGETVEAELGVHMGHHIATHLTSVKPVRGPDGKPVYLVGEARDVSELRGAQEQLRQSQKMEALGQLTGGIAHDFNNLLTVVVGGLDIIAKRESDDKLKRYAQNALEAAERGARLTAQLLAFSRVQRLEVRPTFVAPLIENMRALLRNVLGPGIEKHFELDRDLMPVMADPTQLELAVLNLAINARDAMPEGGVLGFRAKKVTVIGDPELENGDYIELSISDTGAGMSAEVLERAFEPFFTTKDVGKGTGLGLSMVYGVARQSGGTARITSAPGDGTCVRLYFRQAESADEPRLPGEERHYSAVRRPNATVLVIDDDPDVRGFVADSLVDFGYSVREASDGEDGLAEYHHEAPDLVILDFIMPGMSGADVARAIREERPDQPILFVSGYSETEAIKRVAPGAPLLAKPFRADALDSAVRGVLAEARAKHSGS